MIFCGTRNNVDFVANNLNNIGINAKAIHGGMMQNKRNNVMGDFNSKNSVNVLVCTDVAARGLDIKDVSHVYNYDLPKTSSEYIHRIGRTARAGKDGIAISVLCSRDYENFSNILKDEKLKINEIKTPWCERIPIIIQERKGFWKTKEKGSNFNRGRDSAPRRGFGRNNSGGRKSFGGQKGVVILAEEEILNQGSLMEKMKIQEEKVLVEEEVNLVKTIMILENLDSIQEIKIL